MKYRIFLICLCLLTMPLVAQGQVAFDYKTGDRPAFEIAPGEMTTKEITLINTLETPINVLLYATDGKSNESGSFSLRQKNEEQVNIGKWTTMSANNLEFKGKEKKVITLTISVPKNVAPGDYSGGLAVETIRPGTALKSTGVSVSMRVVIPVYVKVTGVKITKYEWNEFSFLNQKDRVFKFNLSNKGNTIIKVSGSIEITDSFNNKTILPINDITLLQNDQIEQQTTWKESPIIGTYTAKASLQFSELDLSKNAFAPQESISKSITFYLIPYLYLLLLTIIAGIIIILVIFQKIKHKAFLKTCSKYKTQKGDNLKNLAQKNKTTWKKLVKINRLKAPYAINEGDTILIPPSK